MAYPTRIRYGLRLLMRLASQGGRRLSIGSVAVEEGVSVKYLEQIVNLLRPLGIITSTRGPRGGYELARDPAQVTLESIFDSLGGLTAPVPCLDAPAGCSRTPVCMTRPFWLEFDAHMRKYLRSQTLRDLMPNAPGEMDAAAKFPILERIPLPAPERTGLPGAYCDVAAPPALRKRKSL